MMNPEKKRRPPRPDVIRPEFLKEKEGEPHPNGSDERGLE